MGQRQPRRIPELFRGARFARQMAWSRKPHKRGKMRAAARRPLGNRRENVRKRPLPSGRINFAGTRTYKRARNMDENEVGTPSLEEIRQRFGKPFIFNAGGGTRTRAGSSLQRILSRAGRGTLTRDCW